MKNKLAQLGVCAVLVAVVFAACSKDTSPINNPPVNDNTISGSCGYNLTWTLDTATCMLTISGTGAMDDYYLYAPAYNSINSQNNTIYKLNKY